MERIASEFPGLAALLFLGLSLGWMLLVAFTAWRLTHPPRKTFAGALARGIASDPSEMIEPRAFTSWSLRSPRGLELPVWDMPGDAQAGPVAVLCHGWGDSRIGALTRAGPWLKDCSRVVCFDFPGHGEAPGWCTLGTSETDDLLALLDAIGDDTPVVLVGWSLGAGVCIDAAARKPSVAAAIFAEAPYARAHTPSKNVMRNAALPYRTNLAPALMLLGPMLKRGLGWAWGSVFDRRSLAKRVRVPLLVLHGQNDQVCPIADGEAIAEAAELGRLVTIDNAGHNDLWNDPDYRSASAEAATSFLRSLKA